MSKSLEYVLKKNPDYREETIIEKTSNPYFELTLKGKRELNKNSIKTIINFNPDDDFNYCNSWGKKINIPFSEELLDVEINYTAISTLLEILHLPFYKPEELNVCKPEHKDIIYVTYGNFIINIKDRKNDSCYIRVSLPFRYEYIRGEHDE